MNLRPRFFSLAAGGERRGSVASNAPSELSRSDVATRGKSKADNSHIREQPKNYYKVVYENKEVNKLLQMLGTAISATKAVSGLSTNIFHSLSSQLLISPLWLLFSLSLFIFDNLQPKLICPCKNHTT